MCKRNWPCLYQLVALIGVPVLVIPGGVPICAHVQISTPLVDYGILVTEPVEIPAWVSVIEIVVPLLIASLALAIYFVHKAHQASTNKKEKK